MFVESVGYPPFIPRRSRDVDFADQWQLDAQVKIDSLFHCVARVAACLPRQVRLGDLCRVRIDRGAPLLVESLASPALPDARPAIVQSKLSEVWRSVIYTTSSCSGVNV